MQVEFIKSFDSPRPEIAREVPTVAKMQFKCEQV